MCQFRQKRTHFISKILLAALILSIVSHLGVFACEPSLIPIYLLHYETESQNLPEGVWLGQSLSEPCRGSILNSENRLMSDSSDAGSLVVSNRSESPLFLFPGETFEHLRELAGNVCVPVSEKFSGFHPADF